MVQVDGAIVLPVGYMVTFLAPSGGAKNEAVCGHWSRLGTWSTRNNSPNGLA
jgi:hypothetical protein